MPGPWHGWLLVEDSQGNAYEVINQARTAAYLQTPALALDEVSICDVLDFGGCATYALGPDEVVVSGGYIDFPGTPSGNYASIPSGAIPSGSGDMTVVAAVAAADWSPSSIQTVAAHWATGERSWSFDLATTGALRWVTSVDGSAATTTHTSSSNLSTFTNATKHWVAVTFDADNGAAGRTTRFWTSANGTTWTQLGAAQTTAGTTTLHGSEAEWTIGSAATPFTGDVYEVSIRNGIGTGGTVGGTEVFRFDGDTDLVGASDATTVFVSSTGDPVSLHRAGSPYTDPIAPTSRCDLVPIDFDTPATDGCPWYNAAYPESGDALGFYISEWTGLDDGHVRRDASPRGGHGGGSSLGVVAAEGRTMALNIMLFARTEAAMDYLFRWLSNTLNSVCSTCSTNSILIRRVCGDTSDPWNGVAELRQVGVIAGLKWESDVGRRARCFIRRASFTLMAGDPCMYLPSTERPVNVDDYDASLSTFFNDDHPPDSTRALCRPSCSELTANARASRTIDVSPVGGMAPVVTWTNTLSNDYTYPFRAVVYYDPMGVGTDNPNPCGLQILGELYVRPIPPAAAVRWDVAGRQILFRDPSTGGWTPSWTYVDANDPPHRRFFTLPCGTSHVVMEPASMCAEETGGSIWELDGIEYAPIRFPDVDIALSERVSCP